MPKERISRKLDLEEKPRGLQTTQKAEGIEHQRSIAKEILKIKV